MRITPQTGSRSVQGDGTIDRVEASTELVVQSGERVMIGGTEESAEVMRQFLLGYERVNQANQVSILLMADRP